MGGHIILGVGGDYNSLSALSIKLKQFDIITFDITLSSDFIISAEYDDFIYYQMEISCLDYYSGLVVYLLNQFRCKMITAPKYTPEHYDDADEFTLRFWHWSYDSIEITSNELLKDAESFDIEFRFIDEIQISDDEEFVDYPEKDLYYFRTLETTGVFIQSIGRFLGHNNTPYRIIE